MNGELAQYFALATHGSAWLDGRTASIPARPEQTHRAFEGVGAVTFGDTDSVLGWLQRLSAERVDRLWLAMPDLLSGDGTSPLPWHHQAAFAGGLPAGLLATSSSGNQLWRASWDVGDRDAPDHRIWQVTYHNTPVSFGPQRPDTDQAAATLIASLERAQAFATRYDLYPWHGVFARARQQWFARDAEPAYHPDLLPDGCYDDASRRLASMAHAAWVFGGMGSWNDLGFPETKRHAEYERITHELFAALMYALLASANADLTAT
ncbi:hypothetical protein E0H26_13470 [Micromonospora zingiberis]|uniref:Uncharacterized protein n=1 Tax=Micromonospora zingiberis TaxID=2053011 RepID=A0A4R0GIN0_9ACTN|nr:hypothetical protein [Micromonospora zingiberis]TCB97270.1 hypothetical protein E0H26_13470 [Micromonospora zingiberis]